MLPFTVLINPVVEPAGDETEEFFEGCLSVSGFSALVRRWRAVTVEALDERGAPVRLRLEGWPARIVQHEADHLAGTLYVDRMDTRSFTTISNLGRQWKSRPAVEIVPRSAMNDGGFRRLLFTHRREGARMPERGPARYFPLIEWKYGKSIQEWKAIIRSSRLTTWQDMTTMLTWEYGMGQTHANALVLHTLREG